MGHEFKNKVSLILILGLIFKKLPLFLLQPVLRNMMVVMQKKHSGIFNRLSEDNFDFIIDATDLPFVFYLKPSEKNPLLKAMKRDNLPSCSATIRGSLVTLLQLFEGKIDGDAAFFSKDLVVEGSTVAIVALRNAVDSEDMNILEDLSSLLHPFEKIFISLSKMGISQYASIQNDIDTVVHNLSQPILQEIQKAFTKIDTLESTLSEIKESIVDIKKQTTRKKADYNKVQS